MGLAFKYRQNPDKSWDSTCPVCSLIVARVDDPAQLPEHESKHICNPKHIKPMPVDFAVFLAR
jgi:hypothetical protein